MILGKQGWLYYDGEPGDHFIDIYYRSVKPFTISELETWRTALEERQRWLAKDGILYLVVLAPNKETIYPEFLPDAVNKMNANTRLDQLVNHLRSNTTIDVLDLRGGSSRRKEEGTTILSDRHALEQLGAYIAYE